MSSKRGSKMGSQSILSIVAFLIPIHFAFAAGGTSGGGGNIDPLDPVTADEIITAVQMAKPVVRSWLSARYRDYVVSCTHSPTSVLCQAYSKLFKPDNSVFTLTKNLEVE